MTYHRSGELGADGEVVARRRAARRLPRRGRARSRVGRNVAAAAGSGRLVASRDRGFDRCGTRHPAHRAVQLADGRAAVRGAQLVVGRAPRGCVAGGRGDRDEPLDRAGDGGHRVARLAADRPGSGGYRAAGPRRPGPCRGRRHVADMGAAGADARRSLRAGDGPRACAVSARWRAPWTRGVAGPGPALGESAWERGPCTPGVHRARDGRVAHRRPMGGVAGATAQARRARRSGGHRGAAREPVRDRDPSLSIRSGRCERLLASHRRVAVARLRGRGASAVPAVSGWTPAGRHLAPCPFARSVPAPDRGRLDIRGAGLGALPGDRGTAADGGARPGDGEWRSLGGWA